MAHQGVWCYDTFGGPFVCRRHIISRRLYASLIDCTCARNAARSRAFSPLCPHVCTHFPVTALSLSLFVRSSPPHPAPVRVPQPQRGTTPAQQIPGRSTLPALTQTAMSAAGAAQDATGLYGRCRTVDDFLIFSESVDIRSIVAVSPRFWYGKDHRFVPPHPQFEGKMHRHNNDGGDKDVEDVNAGIAVLEWEHVDEATRWTAMAELYPDPWHGTESPSVLPAPRDEGQVEDPRARHARAVALRDYGRRLELYGGPGRQIKYLCVDGRTVIERKMRLGHGMDELPVPVQVLRPRMSDAPTAGAERGQAAPSAALAHMPPPFTAFPKLSPTEVKFIALTTSQRKAAQKRPGLMDYLEVAALHRDRSVAKHGPVVGARSCPRPITQRDEVEEHIQDAYRNLRGSMLRSGSLAKLAEEGGRTRVDDDEDMATGVGAQMSVGHTAPRPALFSGGPLLDTRRANVLGAGDSDERAFAREGMMKFLQQDPAIVAPLAGPRKGARRARRQLTASADTYFRALEMLDGMPLTQSVLKMLDVASPGLLPHWVIDPAFKIWDKCRGDEGTALFLFWFYKVTEECQEMPFENSAQLQHALDAHERGLLQFENQFRMLTARGDRGQEVDGGEGRLATRLAGVPYEGDVFLDWAFRLEEFLHPEGSGAVGPSQPSSGKRSRRFSTDGRPPVPPIIPRIEPDPVIITPVPGTPGSARNQRRGRQEEDESGGRDSDPDSVEVVDLMDDGVVTDPKGDTPGNGRPQRAASRNQRAASARLAAGGGRGRKRGNKVAKSTQAAAAQEGGSPSASDLLPFPGVEYTPRGEAGPGSTSAGGVTGGKRKNRASNPSHPKRQKTGHVEIATSPAHPADAEDEEEAAPAPGTSQSRSPDKGVESGNDAAEAPAKTAAESPEKSPAHSVDERGGADKEAAARAPGTSPARPANTVDAAGDKAAESRKKSPARSADERGEAEKEAPPARGTSPARPAKAGAAAAETRAQSRKKSSTPSADERGGTEKEAAHASGTSPVRPTNTGDAAGEKAAESPEKLSTPSADERGGAEKEAAARAPGTSPARPANAGRAAAETRAQFRKKSSTPSADERCGAEKEAAQASGTSPSRTPDKGVVAGVDAAPAREEEAVPTPSTKDAEKEVGVGAPQDLPHTAPPVDDGSDAEFHSAHGDPPRKKTPQPTDHDTPEAVAGASSAVFTPTEEPPPKTAAEAEAICKGGADAVRAANDMESANSTSTPTLRALASQVFYAGQARFPNVAARGFAVRVRELLEPAFAIGVKVACVLSSWRAAHSACNQRCCQVSGVCKVDPAERYGSGCPCPDCVRDVVASCSGLVLTGCPADEAAMYSQWFGRIFLREDGVWCIPAQYLQTDDSGFYAHVPFQKAVRVLEPRQLWRMAPEEKETYESQARESQNPASPPYSQDARPDSSGRCTAEDHLFSTQSYFGAMWEQARLPHHDVDEGHFDYLFTHSVHYISNAVGKPLREVLNDHGCCVDTEGSAISQSCLPAARDVSLILSMPDAMPLFSYGLSALATPEKEVHSIDPDPFGASLCDRFCVLMAFPNSDGPLSRQQGHRPEPDLAKAPGPQSRPQRKKATRGKRGVGVSIVPTPPPQPHLHIYASKAGTRTRSIENRPNTQLHDLEERTANPGDLVVVRDDVAYGFPRGLKVEAFDAQHQEHREYARSLSSEASEAYVADACASLLHARVHFRVSHSNTDWGASRLRQRDHIVE